MWIKIVKFSHGTAFQILNLSIGQVIWVKFSLADEIHNFKCLKISWLCEILRAGIFLFI